MDLFEIDWEAHDVDDMSDLGEHFRTDAVTWNQSDCVTTAITS